MIEVLSLFLIVKLDSPYDGLEVINHLGDIVLTVILAAVPPQAALLHGSVARRHAEEAAHGVLHQTSVAVVAVGEGQRDVVDAPPAPAARSVR